MSGRVEGRTKGAILTKWEFGFGGFGSMAGSELLSKEPDWLRTIAIINFKEPDWLRGPRIIKILHRSRSQTQIIIYFKEPKWLLGAKKINTDAA
jgi:hypothetical protein